MLYVSVVVATKNRSDSLRKLLHRLVNQTYQDFDVAIIDDGSEPGHAEKNRDYCNCASKNISVKYFHTKAAGVAAARNYGISKCTGEIIACTDDDCLPSHDWISSAIKYFDDSRIAGIEGLIISDVDPSQHGRYKIVSNERFLSGKSCFYAGFMTANMFYRRSVLEKVGGFDEKFRLPFREDSDIAWRVLKHGQIPFASDVVVLHPAKKHHRWDPLLHYVNDAYLLHKHPTEFIELFKSQPLLIDPRYWFYVIKGARKFHVHVPVWRLAAIKLELALKRLRRGKHRRKSVGEH